MHGTVGFQQLVSTQNIAHLGSHKKAHWASNDAECGVDYLAPWLLNPITTHNPAAPHNTFITVQG